MEFSELDVEYGYCYGSRCRRARRQRRAGIYAAAMTGYGRMCGWTLARAHARTGDRIAIAAYLGGSESSTRPWVVAPADR